MAFWPPLAVSVCMHARLMWATASAAHEEKASAAEDGDDEEEDL